MEPNSVGPSVLVQSSHEFIQAVLKLSEAYLYEARLEDALRLLDADVLELVERELAPGDGLRVQYQRARILRHRCSLDRSGYDAALDILLRAKETSMALDDKCLLADILDLTGEVLYEQELWHSTLDAPLAHFKQGLELRRETGNRSGIANSLLHIGWVYQHKTDADGSDTQRAFEHFQEAYCLAEETDCPLVRAEAARHMADIHQRRGDLDRALSGHLEFVNISENVGFRLFLPRGYVMVGISYLLTGELDKALVNCERARAQALDMGFESALAEALFGLGAVEEAARDYDTALALYREALEMAQSARFDLVANLATQKLKSLTDTGTNGVQDAR
jgi:tetratricopeptide (TPR) repeat protein